MKVLIVDDEVLVRKGLSIGIDWKVLGFNEIKEASNGIEALEYAKVNFPDLVFTDINMPQMGGLELIKELKNYCPDTIIIVLSCINDMEYVREAMKYNRAFDYIPKLSMSTEELIEIIKKATNNIKSKLKYESVIVESKELSNIFTSQIEGDLKYKIECNDKEACEKIINDCINTAILNNLNCNSFTEWHDIFSVLSSILRQIDGNINSIEINNLKAFNYFENSINLEDMKNRFHFFIEKYFYYLNELRNSIYTKEVQKAIEYINIHYKENITLSQVASLVSMNETYFSRLFKKNVGINFVDYLNKLRIEKAKILIEKNEISICDISYEVGYNNESYFSRIFKNTVGLSPKQYYKSIK